MKSGLDRVREAAKRDKDAKFSALLHHVTIESLEGAYRRLKPNAAAGVDGVTWRAYGGHEGEDLEPRLQNLLQRVHRGAYRAKPSRRTYIPKGDGGRRPLGIASLEDKILQSATTELLNAIYEKDFLGFSYGFRPGRGPHDALDALSTGLVRRKVNWVLDADIRGFFDNIDQTWLMKFVEHRISDKRVLRLIRKWLRAGVMEDGDLRRAKRGTPQGAVISPLLANIYLHYVFDLWAHRWRKVHATGDVVITRYADDFVVGFQREQDARRFREDLEERLRRFALELHPEKTRLIEFGRFAASNRKKRGDGKPETFDFLGFTHRCEKSRKGWFIIARTTIRKRLRDKLKAIRLKLWRRMHDPVREVAKWLRAVVRGYLNYHAVPMNSRAIRSFRREVERAWLTALRRRSQRGKRKWTWARFHRLSVHWLPLARIQHPWPTERFDARLKVGAV